MKKIIKQILTASFLLALTTAPFFAAAESSALKNLKTTAEEGSNAPYTPLIADQNDIAGMVKIIINAFLSLLGVIFLIYIIYAGYNWMTAQGEEEKVEKAKNTLTRAVIGLIIIVAAYSITFFVFKSLSGVGTGGAQTGPIK